MSITPQEARGIKQRGIKFKMLKSETLQIIKSLD